MDPASIIGVIGVAAQLLKLIHVYGDGVAECRDEVAALRVELFCLKSALTQIERDAGLTSSLQSDEFQKMLEEARKLLVTITDSLKPEASRAQKLAQRLTWPLKRQHVKDLTTRLERLKTYFILIATNDIRDAARVFASSLEGIQQTLAEMQMGEEYKTTQAATSAWLTSFDPESAYQAALSARSEGTNKWFLDGTLRHWSRGTIQLLWLRGKPGSGKTCIAAACASRLMNSPKNPNTAHFYCSYNNAESQKPRTIVASLVKQLASKNPEIQYEVLQSYKEDLQTQNTSGSTTASLSTLTQLLIRNYTDTSQDVFFVIDAIDEGGEEAKEMLEAVFLIASQCPRFRIVLTSTESMTGVVREASNELGISSMDVYINSENIGDDIDIYTRTRFSNDRMLSKLRPQLQADIMNKIKDEHKGSFRWAQCTIDDLSSLATPRAIRDALAGITPSLSNVYKSVLSSIPHAVSSIAWSMLVYLVSALRPLLLRELAEAAVFLSSPDFSEDDRLIDPESIIRHLRCLVRYDTMTKRVELAHSSVRDFLTDEGQSGNFYIDDIAAYRSMCRVCIEYLVLPPFEAPCSRIKDLEERHEKWPLLEYAAKKWTEHVRLLKDVLPNDIEASIRRFFSSAERDDGGHFAAWYQCTWPTRSTKVWATKPLYICAREGLVDLLKVILPHTTKDQLEEHGGSRGSTALHVAAAFGQIEAVELLLGAGADPRESNDFGEAGIQWAWFWGHLAIVRALLKGGADPALIDWEPHFNSRTSHNWKKAGAYLREMHLREGLGLDRGKITSLPMRLAAIMSPTPSEGEIKNLRQELLSQDFKIPPNASSGSSPHSDHLGSILKAPE